MVTKKPAPLKYERCIKCKTQNKCQWCSYHQAVLRYARNGKDYRGDKNVVWRNASPSERRALKLMTKGSEQMRKAEERKGVK